MSYSTVVSNVVWPHTHCTPFVLIHLERFMYTCIPECMRIFVTVLAETVSVMKEQELLLMV